MGSSRFSCCPEVLGSVCCSWGCPLCVVWEGTSCPALLSHPEPSHRWGQTGESKWLWDLRGMVRNGIGEGTSPQATAEQGLQDTAGLDMWAEGGVPGREQPMWGWEVPVVILLGCCVPICATSRMHLAGQDGRLGLAPLGEG